MLWWEDCCWTQWREGWRVLHSGEIGRLPQSSSKNTSNLNWDWICKASCACILLFPALTLIQKRNSLEPMEVLPHGSAHTCASTSTFRDQYFLHSGTSTSVPIFSRWKLFWSHQISPVFSTSLSGTKRHGHGQHAVIRVRVQLRMMTNGPIRAKQVIRSSYVIAWLSTGQGSSCSGQVLQNKCTLHLYSTVSGPSKVWAPLMTKYSCTQTW